MSFEAWRISHQSSEQAARVAYTQWQSTLGELQKWKALAEAAALGFDVCQRRQARAQQLGLAASSTDDPADAVAPSLDPDLVAAIQREQHLAEAEGDTECGQQHRQLAGWLLRLMRMEHDFSSLSAFHHKHALGPMLPPSCLVCGQQTVPAELCMPQSVAIKHAELAGIVVCKHCRDAALGAGKEA